MATLRLTISSENVSRTRDLLVCLSKFSETVAINATAEALILSCMNISQTSFSTFMLDAKTYFESYELSVDTFSCSVPNKSLSAIFKVRLADPRDLDTAVEKCELSVFDGVDRAACKITAKLICRHGVKKTFKLNYEPASIQYPEFDDARTHNTWTISAHSLKALSEHFGARTEHLDFYQDADRMLLTSYTEKIARGSEILKQPLQTTIALDRLDFEHIRVEEHLHVGISVKDFRALVTHAETVGALISVKYSQPKQPMRMSYEAVGLRCDFTLATMNEYLGPSIKHSTSVPQNRVPAPTSNEEISTAARVQQERSFSAAPSISGHMSAPPLPESMRTLRNQQLASLSRPSPPPPQASINQESLFLTDADEDEARWGEANLDDDNDAVRWDTGDSLNKASLSHSRNSRNSLNRVERSRTDGDEFEVPPTQRFSQIRGLFDD